MKKIRLHNTFTVRWPVTDSSGSAIDLANMTVRLFLTTPKGRKEISSDEFQITSAQGSVVNNVVVWKFDGADQYVTGTYVLTLQITDTESNMKTCDYEQAFRLVGSSAQSEGLQAGNVLNLADV